MKHKKQQEICLCYVRDIFVFVFQTVKRATIRLTDKHWVGQSIYLRSESSSRPKIWQGNQTPIQVSVYLFCQHTLSEH